MRGMRKRILIALRMSSVAGQEKYKGIFNYLGTDHDWDITFIRSAAGFTSARVRKAIEENYDGYIVSIPGTERAATFLADIDAPTVVIDLHDPRLSARTRNIAFIRNSADEIGAEAANHLVSVGTCRSYAFVHNPSVMQWSVERFRAFRETLRDRGLWCHELKEPEELRKMERPCGVLAANDDTGFDILEWCRAHHYGVPREFAVLGINNDTLICENCQPKLSSLEPDFEREGYLAAETLDRMMEEPASPRPSPRTLYVGVKDIVRRGSTAESSPSGKLVQKAIAYIHRHALEGIGVEDVVRHLQVSRRLADLRFHELQYTSIGEEITRVRLAEVKRLLRSTKDPIDSIAVKCGFRNPNYLKNLFRKRFSMSMREFRKMS